MKIAAIIAPAGEDFGLNAAYKIVCETLTETGEDVEVFNLVTLGLDYYNGVNGHLAHDIMEGIKSADGVIFAFSAFLTAPNALILSFMEYFADDIYRQHLANKPCLLLAISQNGTQRSALEAMANSVLFLSGHDVVRIGLNTVTASVVQKSVIELLERQTEDFYRILRQNRKYFCNLQFTIGAAQPSKKIISPNVDFQELYKKHSLDDLDDMPKEQQEDIEKISAMFAKRYVSENDTITPVGDTALYTSASGSQGQNPAYKSRRSTKQLTAALPHYYNPHLAKDLDTTIQLNITGKEGFEGYIILNPKECIFNEGEAEKNDILITADAAAWRDVLDKKLTAQKAFMMGQLKVRGNFVLLTKFDQLFNSIT
jgi:putative sterol carrier protein/multimeric flavodoxin WrbA